MQRLAYEYASLGCRDATTREDLDAFLERHKTSLLADTRGEFLSNVAFGIYWRDLCDNQVQQLVDVMVSSTFVASVGDIDAIWDHPGMCFIVSSLCSPSVASPGSLVRLLVQLSKKMWFIPVVWMLESISLCWRERPIDSAWARALETLFRAYARGRYAFDSDNAHFLDRRTMEFIHRSRREEILPENRFIVELAQRLLLSPEADETWGAEGTLEFDPM